jgi:sarcosine oxidase
VSLPRRTAVGWAMNASVDVAIIGAGITGLMTALALRDRGVSVACIDSGRPGGAQSAGLVRLLYSDFAEEAVRAKLLQARKAWEQLEQRWSRRLFGRGGAVVAPERIDSGVPLDCGLMPLVGEEEQALVRLDPDAGAIRAARTIELLCAELADALVSAHVLGIADHGDGVDVLTNECSIRADRLVVCAGLGGASLAEACGISIPVVRDLHERLMFPVSSDLLVHAQQDDLPAWIDQRSSSDVSVYGLPVGRTGMYALGIGGRDGDVPVERAFGATEELGELRRTRERLCAYVRAVLPGLVPEPVAARSCVITHNATGPEDIGVWQSATGSVSFLAGNNMFMFAPVLGTELADVAGGAPVPAWLDPAVHARRAAG